MAISRAQLLKELLPGLNALFGLEYARYGEEHKEIYETETSERARGGTFLLGGGSNGLYFEPTIVDGVTSDFLMARDETFGPVAPIMTFGTIDEAIEIANETPYGLQGAAFTSSLRNAFLLGEGIRCGTVLINESNNYWDQLAPFGGMKKSGLGREQGMAALAAYSEYKSVFIQND